MQHQTGGTPLADVKVRAVLPLSQGAAHTAHLPHAGPTRLVRAPATRHAPHKKGRAPAAKTGTAPPACFPTVRLMSRGHIDYLGIT